MPRFMQQSGTLAKTCFRIPDEPAKGAQPVGFTLPECQVFFFDEHNGGLSSSGEGEIWLRTPHRTRGYLTGGGDAFVRNPFGSDPDDTLYRTGDIGNLDREGRLVVRGRVDEQVKVNGVRIEPIEVEGAIESHPLVRTATVLPIKMGSKVILFAFYVQADGEITDTNLKSHVRRRLPEFMVPSVFLEVDNIPLLPNGKVDRRSLVARWKRGSEAGFRLGAMVAIWSEAFGHPIDPGKDFFELGGDSAAAASILAGVFRATGRELAFDDFLANASCERLMAIVNVEESIGDEEAGPREGRRSSYGSIMNEQQRTLFETVLVCGSTSATNVTRFVDVPGQTQEADVRRALSLLSMRFVALRQYFRGRPDSPSMAVSNNAPIPLRGLRISKMEEADLSSCEGLIDFVTEPIDVFEAPLARAIFLVADDHVPVVGLAVHHVVVDGISMGVLMRVLSRVIGADTVDEQHCLPIDPEFVPECGSPEGRARSREYWSRIFSEPYGVLDIRPGDGDEALGLVARIEWIPGKLVEAIERCRSSQRISTFSIFFAGYHMALSRRFGRSDIVVNIFAEGLERTIERDAVGCFYRPLPIRLNADYGSDGLWCARESYRALVDAQCHQMASYGDIVKHVERADVTGRGRFPLTSLAANYVEDVEGMFRFWGRSGQVRRAPIESVYDLTFFLGGKDRRQFALCGRRDVVRASDVREICRAVRNNVESMVEMV